MSQGYPAIDWNPRKRRYDAWIAGVSVLFLGAFIGGMALLNPNARPETFMLRSTGILALLMLHAILAIGPLARLQPRLLPLLYNRRHVGVSMAIVASVHAMFALFQFHGLGNVPWLVSLFSGGSAYGSVADFPFQVLGFLAWMQIMLMAATSHDAWLAILGPRQWKALHLGVYLAYALLLGHVLLGVMQLEQSTTGVVSLLAGAVLLVGLHLAAAAKGRQDGRETSLETTPADDGFVHAGAAADIPMDRARTVSIGDCGVAVYRHAAGISAVRNACKHQGGPLAEGKVVDGCITCPWHGWQYRPEDGCSPPPFDEKVATYRIRIDAAGDVWVHPEALPEGTSVTPVPLPQQTA